MAKKLPVIIVLGATGAGKSKLALQIATKFSGEIISTDSMQIYKGLDIVTNKVTHEERRQCAHHLIDYLSPLTCNHTVVEFRDKAVPIIDQILSDNKIPVIVGGTNYYIEALLWNTLIPNKKQDGSIEESEKAPSVDTTAKNHPPKITEDGTGSGGNKTEEGGTILHNGPTDTSNREDIAQLSVKDMYREKYGSLTTGEVYEKLKAVDPVTALKIHPNDRRKMTRAIEVFEQTGKSMSEHLDTQHSQDGASGIRGPLRYPENLFIWVQCDQKVLDERTDARVDKMIEAGLINELTKFHKEYNQTRIQQNKTADYTLGIFQSIGFKEFHEYLLLDEEQREMEAGKALFSMGVDEMKRETRRYARYQNKWIRSRLLKRKGGPVPPIYAVDSTDPVEWNTNVYEPAIRIIDSVLKGETPVQEPLPVEESEHRSEYNVCDFCGGSVFVTVKDWKAHLSSRRHQKAMASARARARRKKMQEETKSEGTSTDEPNSKQPLQSDPT